MSVMIDEPSPSLTLWLVLGWAEGCIAYHSSASFLKVNIWITTLKNFKSMFSWWCHLCRHLLEVQESLPLPSIPSLSSWGKQGPCCLILQRSGPHVLCHYGMWRREQGALQSWRVWLQSTGSASPICAFLSPPHPLRPGLKKVSPGLGRA